MAKIVNKRRAAQLLGGVSTKTVDRLRTAGELDTLRVGSRVMIVVVSIDEYLERQIVAARARHTASTGADSVAADPFPISALSGRRDG